MSMAGRFHLLSSDILSDRSNHLVTAAAAQSSVVSRPQSNSLINKQHRQDVQVLNSPSANSYRPSVGIPNTNNTRHDSLNRQPPRREFYKHGIPHTLPPTPVTTFVSNSFVEPKQPHSAQPSVPTVEPSAPYHRTNKPTAHSLIPQLSAYMSMLNNKNDTVHGAPAPAPIIEPRTPAKSATNLSPDEEIMNWINSPMPDTDASLASFLESPMFETPLFQDRDSFDAEDTPFMPTPSLEVEQLYPFCDPDIFGASPSLMDSNSFAAMTGVGIEPIPLIGPPSNVQFAGKELGDFWDVANESPALPPSSLVAPTAPAAAAAAPKLADNSAEPIADNSPASAPAKEKKWTGTRPNITREALIPLDAPVQLRSYITPSSTSRKDIPAAFVNRTSRKRGADEMLDEGDDLKRQIEAKRLQNTMAARRSRARKLDYQRGLEEENERLREENEVLRKRVTELERR